MYKLWITREREWMVNLNQRYSVIPQNLIIIGFGIIGQAVLPLIFRHCDIKPSKVTILTKKSLGFDNAHEFGVTIQFTPLTKENYISILNQYTKPGDFVLNLSVDVSSLDLITYCQKNNIIYLDTCTEPWAGTYTDSQLPAAERTNYALREKVIALKKTNQSTAVITHGANPGLISHFVKQALINLAIDNNLTFSEPETSHDWALLAEKLTIKSIHIAERDTQITNQTRAIGEFVNTWSVEGFLAEGSQPAELGWGTHEQHWPPDAHQHANGSQCAIFLDRPGASTRVRSWTPNLGPHHGFLITHAESVSIANYLTVIRDEKISYRPTVHYAYTPCPDAILSLNEFAGNNWQLPDKHRLLLSEIESGYDELGVLLMGNEKGAYWYGSHLTIDDARKLAPNNSATTLQVASGVLAGMIWALRNPAAGIVEPEDLDYKFVMGIALPYLGKVAGYYTDWTPIKHRGILFKENMDLSDPWQFINIRVN